MLYTYISRATLTQIRHGRAYGNDTIRLRNDANLRQVPAIFRYAAIIDDISEGNKRKQRRGELVTRKPINAVVNAIISSCFFPPVCLLERFGCKAYNYFYSLPTSLLAGKLKKK